MQILAKDLKPGMRIVEKCFGGGTEILIVKNIYLFDHLVDIGLVARPSIKNVQITRVFNVEEISNGP